MVANLKKFVKMAKKEGMSEEKAAKYYRFFLKSGEIELIAKKENCKTGNKP